MHDKGLCLQGKPAAGKASKAHGESGAGKKSADKDDGATKGARHAPIVFHVLLLCILSCNIFVF